MSSDLIKLTTVFPTITYDEVGLALDGLIGLAKQDTSGSSRAADFLLSWWNGNDWGHFPIISQKQIDQEYGNMILVILTYLNQNGTYYADHWGRRADMVNLIYDWRGADKFNRD